MFRRWLWKCVLRRLSARRAFTPAGVAVAASVDAARTRASEDASGLVLDLRAEWAELVEGAVRVDAQGARRGGGVTTECFRPASAGVQGGKGARPMVRQCGAVRFRLRVRPPSG